MRKREGRGDRHGQQPHGQRAQVRHRGEVDPEDQRPDEDDREDAPQVVHGIGRLVDVARNVDDRHQQGDADERKRDEEDRSPPELLQERARDQRPERGDAAADRGPERDRLRACRPCPERRDQSEGRRVGHAGREAAEETGGEEHLVRGRVRRQERRRHGQDHAQHEQELPSVAVPDRAQPEHRRREAERVADRDQVQRRLGRVERLADRGQGDVGDRQVQVGDRRHQDERDEDEPRPLRSRRRRGCDCFAHSSSQSSKLQRPP